MRVFVGLLGGLFLILGLVALAGGAVLVLGSSYDTPGYYCSSSVAGGSLTCDPQGDDVVEQQTYALGAGIVGGSLLIGGCALIGGAVAGGRKQAAATYQQQPTASAGPPSYSGGWQGSQGADTPRS